MNRQSFFTLVITAIFIFGSFYQFAAQESPMSQVRDAFLKMGQKEEWSVSSEPEVAERSELLEFDEDISDYPMEYDVDFVFRGSFSTAKDSQLLKLRLFTLPSQVEAFGFYSRDKTPSLNFVEIGYQSYFLRQRLVSWYSSYVIYTETTDTLPNREKYLKDFAEEFIRLLPKKKKNTPILDCLPEKQRVKFSEKFYTQRWLDQEFFRNIYYADYYTSAGYSRIFIIDNLNTETADSNFWKYRNYMKLYSAVINDTLKIQTDYFVVNDPLWGLTILAKKNKIIYGVLDYHEKKWAEERLAELLNELKKRNIVKSG
jgi:hypothetical protein